MREARIAIVGDFNPALRSHTATNEALAARTTALNAVVDVAWVGTELIASRGSAALADFDGIWAAPGSPYRSIEGALGAIRFARENNKPFFAT